MPAPPPRAVTPLAFAKGVANRMAETKVPPGFVRVADNVDYSSAGTVTRRDGYALFAALVGAHSLWSHPNLGYALVADATQLYQLLPSGALTVIASGLSGAPVQYVDTPIGVYWSNGEACGRIRTDGTAGPWGVEAPPASFTLTAVANVGGLNAGTYGVTLTFVDAYGEESGAPATRFVDVPAGGGISITNVPAAGPDVAEAKLYVTGANSAGLFYAGSVAPGAPQHLLGSGWRGRILATQFCTPFPPVKFPAIKSGRLFGFVGTRLVWSEPLYYGLTNSAKDFMIVSREAPTMLGFPDTAEFFAYIGTSVATYKLQGSALEDARLSIAAHQGVQPGSMVMMEPDAVNIELVHGAVPVWVDTVGVPMAGTASMFGTVPLHQKFVYPVYDQAAAAFVRIEGEDRYLMGGRGGRPSGLVASDYVVARVYNNGGGA